MKVINNIYIFHAHKHEEKHKHDKMEPSYYLIETLIGKLYKYYIKYWNDGNDPESLDCLFW